MNEVVVTEKGRQAISESIVCFQEVESAILKGFSDQEMEQLSGFLQRMIANGEDYSRSSAK